MIDWTQSMIQSFNFFKVDPNTWADDTQLKSITKAVIKRDSSLDTLGSASFDCTEELDEQYVRTYLNVIQNGVVYDICLGTHLIQSPSNGFNGMVMTNSVDGYTPLIELKENSPPLGFFVKKGTNIMDYAYRLISEQVRCPVVKTTSSVELTDDFIANTNDTYISFIKDLIGIAEYELAIDSYGTILFSPKTDINAIQSVFTYTDDNSSILYPDITVDRDLYGIPNTVIINYNGLEAIAVNDSPNSPVSTTNRGRKIIYRPDASELLSVSSQDRLDKLAKKILKEKSSIEYTITYTHGYCPVRVGDGILLNYKNAGLSNIKATVTSQSISCEPGCPVVETAVYTTNLWG